MAQKKTAVVVGATGNLGQAICTALEAKGFHIDEVWRSENRPDCTKAESYNRLPAKIDAAIYVAGINRVTKAEELTEDTWDEVFNINLRGAFLFASKAFPAMKAAGKSCFVTISSIMVTHPYPGRLPYAASKAGLEAMTRSLAVEWGPHGIATHSLRLGHVTGLMKSTVANPKMLDAVREKVPGGKLIPPEDVASYITWLAEGGAHSMNGAVAEFDPAYAINRWPL